MDIHRARFVDYSPHTITAMAFSHKSQADAAAPANLRLAVGRSNGDIEVWNPRHGWTHELTLYGARGRSIEGLCWALDDQVPRLFSIGGSTVVTEWDMTTQKPAANYDCNAGIIWSIDSSASGKNLAVGCDDGSVVIIDISGGPGSLEHLLVCQRQDLRVLSVCWYEDELVVGGCADARLRCWATGAVGSTGRGRLIGTMRVDKSKTESTLVWSVQVLPESRQIVSGDSTGSVKFWDLNQHTLIQSFKVHDADVLCVVRDASESKIFSAGVDRKIHQFQLIKPSSSTKSSKWVHINSRLLHSNDVRTMAVYEARGCNFLLSGGVEKSIVILSVSHFHDGRYRKLSVTQQRPNVTVNEDQKLIVMWQDQTVKVWKVLNEDGTGKTHKLVSKLSLADDENITHVLINDEASLLAVSTLTSVKLFHLTHDNKKVTVQKIRDTNFDLLVDGAKQVVLYSADKLLILTADNEIYNFRISEESIELESELETHELANSIKHPYGNNINNIVISQDNSQVVISRFNGLVEVLSLKGEESFVLTKLSSCPHIMCFSHSNTLLVVTDENKLYEFYVRNKKTTTKATNTVSLLTPWSKRNSEFLPKQFLTLEDKPHGMFIDQDSTSKRVWIYGSNWLSFFDLSENIPINKQYQNMSNSNRKRDRDGLQVQGSTVEDENNQEIDGNINILEDNVEILELSLKQSQIDSLREKIQSDEQTLNTSDTKPFWMTSKYRPILSARLFLDGIIVVELPSLVSSTPAFDLPKLKV